MPKKKTTVTVLDAASSIPAEVRALFGDPSVLSTEDQDRYWKMLGHLAKCVEPHDIVEWLWIKDILDFSWEILRLRCLRVKLIEREVSVDNTDDAETEYAGYFWAWSEPYERIDKLLASAENRRDRILREIELRRDHIGHRARAASAEILETNMNTRRIAAE